MPYKVSHGKAIQVSYSPDEVFSRIQHEGIQFIDLQFTGLTGHFHHTTISADTFTPEQMRDGLPKLDGSSIVGFTSIDDSDLLLKPDPNTFAIIPWMTENKTARLLCDVYWGENRGRLSRDPRGISQKAEEYIKTQGFDFSTWGPEVEFFVFDKVHWDVLTPYKGQSYSIESKEAPLKNNFGILCDNHHHEVATAGQCEIDIKYDHMTNAADAAQSYKYVIRNVAQKYGKVATMMPKPIAMDSGSGMHVNVSLWKGKENTFFDPDDEDELSQTARYFCGGIINHAKALSAICNPTTNSYHRLVPGYEAPAYIAWSSGNRSAIVRVPKHLKGKEYSNLKRLEFRAPDPSSNPYLVFAAVTAAGMDGLKKKMDPGDQVRDDIFKMTRSDRSKRGIGVLPKSLGEALDELESDRKFLSPIYTNDVIDKIIELERRDQREIAIRPHPHEFYLYFDV
ncbi:Glutamine synthetase protein [Marine Group I thaumarchaeote SCGC RSA3]|uniref:Glutamine synthetase protein n=1 Tax=Marine Group I thaumarchaeote SCGC RSA3 TaxID=1503183 RepID=A0A087RQS5_9ARCH|nr:Glutamine synthetase protein [Marine Group I thaumarchaeote SCGC RSA3]